MAPAGSLAARNLVFSRQNWHSSELVLVSFDYAQQFINPMSSLRSLESPIVIEGRTLSTLQDAGKASRSENREESRRRLTGVFASDMKYKARDRRPRGLYGTYSG